MNSESEKKSFEFNYDYMVHTEATDGMNAEVEEITEVTKSDFISGDRSGDVRRQLAGIDIGEGL